MKIPIKLLEEENLAICYGEPVVFHCNHYNLFLQRTIEDVGSYIDTDKILTEGAVFATYSMFHKLYEMNPQVKEVSQRLSVASSLYSQLGFGLLPMKELTVDGGVLQTPVTHYSFAWREKWGKRNKPVDYFTRGYLQSAMANIFHKPSSHYSVKQTKCITMGDAINEFEITVDEKGERIRISPGTGITIPGRIKMEGFKSEDIDGDEISKAVRGMPLEGGQDGLIPAFGVFLTRHFANYYNYISYETDRLITEKTNEPNLAKDLLIEAGHVCGFNTFGGIMESDEWYGLVAPHCKTKEDWVAGIIGVVNALGWGYWSIAKLEPEKSLSLCVSGSYESNTYTAMYDKSNRPRSYLVTGGTAALMNLLYLVDIREKPVLDEEFYEKYFSSDKSYLAKQTKCRSMGDDRCLAETFLFNE